MQSMRQGLILFWEVIPKELKHGARKSRIEKESQAKGMRFYCIAELSLLSFSRSWVVLENWHFCQGLK